MPKLNPLPYLRGAVTEGTSANAAFRSYQAAARQQSEETGERWTAQRRTTFLQQYSTMRQSRANVADAIRAPKDIAFGGLDPTPRQSTIPGRYLYTGAAFTRQSGTQDLEYTIHMLHSRDLLSPQEIENFIKDQIERSAEDAHGTFANYVIESLMFTGVEQLVPYSEG